MVGRGEVSRGARKAQAQGLESCRVAAQRLKIAPWQCLEAACEVSGEWHHEDIRDAGVEEVDYCEPAAWDAAAARARELVREYRRALAVARAERAAEIERWERETGESYPGERMLDAHARARALDEVLG
jgi:hypothetical protein